MTTKRALETRRARKLMKEIDERLEKLPVRYRYVVARSLLSAMIGRAEAKADEWMAGPDHGNWRLAYWSIGRILGDLRESFQRSVRDSEYRATKRMREREQEAEFNRRAVNAVTGEPAPTPQPLSGKKEG